MDFNGITGQSEIVGSLKHSLTSGRVGHAYIFSGPAGIGKKTVANIFTGFLLCRNPGMESTCSVCRACLLFDSGANPDFRRVRLEEASIGVDAIREIQEDVCIRPMYSKRKVYIVEEADKMTVQAQNCLLKTLEEPPSYVVIILTSSNYEALIETVRSRAQRICFRKYTGGQVRQVVENRLGKRHPGVDIAVNYADGVIGTALDFAGSGDFVLLRDKTFDMISSFPLSNLSDIFGLTAFFEENRENSDLILDTMLLYYRDLLVARETRNEKMLINSDKKDIIFNNARTYGIQRLVANIGQIEDARRALKQNANFQLVLENMLIRLQEVI